MVTMKDIAKEAGVSHGTVSNVLNKTGKVSSDKIRRVEEAAKRLGYKANVQAQMLKLGGARNVALVLPSITIKHFFTIYETLRNELDRSEIDLQLYTTEDIPAIEQKNLDRIYETRPGLIISCSSMKQTSSYLNDIPVIFIDRFLPKNGKNFFHAGFSYYEAGKDIGKYLLSNKKKEIAIFASSSSSFDYTQFQLGLSEVLGSSFPMDFYLSDIKFMMGKAMQLASEASRYDAIIAMDYNRAQALRMANNYTKTMDFPEILCIADNDMFEDSSCTLYHLDYGKLGRNIAGIASSFIKGGVPLHDLLMRNTGFRGRPCFQRRDGETLSILTLESPASEALSRLLPKFQEKTGIKVCLSCLPYDELYRTIKEDGNASSRYDLIRLDMAWLPEIAESKLLPLSDAKSDLQDISSSFIPELSDEYSKVDGTIYALPFDPSVQILFYNSEAFENSRIQRLFYETCKEKLDVPSTFGKHDKVAEFFTRSINPDSPVSYGTTVTCGTSGVAACDFLPRLTEDKSHLEIAQIFLSTSTMQALDAYKASFEYTRKNINTWWKSAIEDFSNGDIAMLTVFMNHASKITNSKHSKIIGKVGFSKVPGGHPLLGGGSIGIGKHSRKIDPAIQFLKWVYSDEIARLYTFFGGISPNGIVYEDPEILGIYPWLSIARDSFREGRRRFADPLEAKNQKALEDVLGIAVRNVVLSSETAESAIGKAKKKISEILG